MITINNLSFSYEEHLVLNNLDKIFQEGMIHGIVGLNGAGKSTFFNLLACVLKPGSGEITFMGNKLRNPSTSYLETNNFFYSLLTGNEYLKIFNQSNKDFDLKSLQKYFHIPLDDLIETYSTGMKKKLALLAVLKEDKPIYLFDEPFNGLDLETNKVVEIILLTLKEKGKTIFVSSHILEPLLSVCDEIHILENKKFENTYLQKDFNQIESDLFTKFKTEAKEIIRKSV